MHFKELSFSILLLSCCVLYGQELPIELGIQSGHYASVTALTFSPDGSILASGGYDRNVILWDMATGRQLRNIEFKASVSSIDFSPDGKLILSILSDGTGFIHEVESGKKLWEKKPEGGYFNVGQFLPNGKQFITSGSTSAVLWSLDQEEAVATFDGERSYCNYNCQHSMDISPDGKWLLLVDREGKVALWNIAKKQLVRQYKHYENRSLSFSGVTSVSFLPDSKTFIVGSEEEGILQWSVSSNENPTILLPAQRITSGITFKFNDLAINKTGTKLIAIYLEGVQGTFERTNNLNYHTYDLTTSSHVNSLDIGEENEIQVMTFDPVSDTLGASSGAVPQIISVADASLIHEFKGHLTDHLANYWIMRATKKHLFLPPSTVIERVGDQVMAWDFKTGKLVRKYPSHTGMVLGMALSPDRKLLATGGADRVLMVSDAVTADTLWKKEFSQEVFTLAFSPDNKSLIVANMAGRMSMWESETGKYVKDLPSTSRDWYQTPLSISFTSTGLITWGDFLKDPESGETIIEFDTHEERVHEVKTTKDGKALLTTGWDGQTFLRDLYYGGKVTPIGEKGANTYCATFSPDESEIATGGTDNKIRVFDKTGKLLFELTGHTGPVVSITYSEDGKYLISGSQDGTIKVWKLEDQRELYTHILLDEERWTTKLPSGHFYSTQKGMESMFFIRGTQTYSLDQFFEKFYQPMLTVDLLGSNYSSDRSELYDQITQLPPPKVEIAYPRNGDTKEERIELLLKLTDQGGGMDEVKVLHNGKRIVFDTDLASGKPGKTIARSYMIDLVPGVNLIQASAFGKSRIESAPDEIKLTRPADEPTSACYVVSIGINKYKNPRLNLNYAVDDAKSMASLIETKSKNLFTTVETLLITDEDATRTNILQQLEELSQKVRPTDVFYFFYAGHGSMMNEDFYFIPSNCTRLYEEAGLKEEALFVGELVEKLKSIKALKQVLFIDACHSGGSTAVLASRGAGEEKALAQLSRSAGVHILAAAGSDQTATEFADLGHGLFTYAVLEALGGKADGAPADNKVTVYELKSFLDDQVPEYSMKYKNTPQYPNTFSIGHDFPIVLKED